MKVNEVQIARVENGWVIYAGTIDEGYIRNKWVANNLDELFGVLGQILATKPEPTGEIE